MGTCAGVLNPRLGEQDVGKREKSEENENSKNPRVKAKNPGVIRIKEEEVDKKKLISLQAMMRGFMYRIRAKRVMMASKGLFNFFKLGVRAGTGAVESNSNEKDSPVLNQNKSSSNSYNSPENNKDKDKENGLIQSSIILRRVKAEDAGIPVAFGVGMDPYSNNNNSADYVKFPVVREKEKQIDQNRKYEGDWVNGMRTGFGRLKWNDGSVYTGMFLNNKAHGFGSLKHPDGDIYTGQWVNDKAQGVGKYINTKESSFQGYWASDKQEGFGYEVWAKGSVFEGSFKDGNKHGVGILKFEDNACYQGEFHKNEINGIGTCVFKDNRKYEGEWKDNKMNGYGILTWPNGKIFQGQFVNDKKEGFGIYYSKNKVYIANWKNSKMHGEVVIIERGIIKKSLWDEGKKIKNLVDDRPLIKEKFITELINSFL